MPGAVAWGIALDDDDRDDLCVGRDEMDQSGDKCAVPDHFIVAASGELQNPADVLTPTQRDRFERARTAPKPMFVVTPEEALANEDRTATGTKTWTYRAENEALKSEKKQGIHLKVSQKGAVSLYGIRRFPVTFYADEWDRIRDDPGRIPAVVEEGLRLLTPTQGMWRVATRSPAPSPM